MNLSDMIALAFDNLRRTRLRTVLTTLGVVIGIGALTSMVSFGTGIQKNITEAFRESDLFTTMIITSQEISLGDMGDPDDVTTAQNGTAEASNKPAPPLTDSTLQVINGFPGVAIAYPEISFPVRVRLGSEATRTTLRALPAAMRAFKPYSKLAFGEFYDDDTSRSAVVSWDALKRLKLLVRDPKSPVSLDEGDSSGVRPVDADSVLGLPIEVISVTFDGSQLGGGSMFGLPALARMPVGESQTTFTIGGIMKGASSFSDMNMAGGIIVPIGAAEAIPRLGFSSVWDLLGGGGGQDTYSSIHVRTESVADMEAARAEIEKMGLHVFAFSDQLKEIRKGFLVMDSILGAIGTIALVVAALGIANTMVMSILERTREIGIMKAIGASETEIKLIFFVEAAAIGVIGAIFGLLLGWGVTRIANFVANARILPAGEPALNLFYFPFWLIAGAVGFSVVISLLAGLYPAIRAANIDPIEALRHD